MSATEAPNTGSAGGKAPKSRVAPLGTPRTRGLRHRVEVRTRKTTLGGWKRTRGAVDKAQARPSGSRDRSLAGKARIQARREARRG